MAWYHHHREIELPVPGLSEGLFLDRECPFCHGVSDIRDSGYPYDEGTGICGVCDGTGYDLTEAGEELLVFLMRHQKRYREAEGE